MRMNGIFILLESNFSLDIVVHLAILGHRESEQYSQSLSLFLGKTWNNSGFKVAQEAHKIKDRVFVQVF